MISTRWWKLQPSLAAVARLPRVSPTQGFALAELAVLAGAGILAACAEAWLHMNLRVPGNAILRAVFPMMLGLALVPRYGAGSTMALFGGLSALAINTLPGEGISLAAGLSMVLVGPAIDLALWSANGGRGLYARFALAGVLANLAALAVKILGALTGLAPMNRPLASFLPLAVPSFIICGALAGLLAAVILFRNHTKSPSPPPRGRGLG